MLQKEVTDSNDTKWTCVQAYAALEDKLPGSINELTETNDGKVQVVCTPSGGAQTVRLELIKNWAEEVSDDQLVEMITKAQ